MTAKMPQGARLPVPEELKTELRELLAKVPIRQTPAYLWNTPEGEAFLAAVAQTIGNQHPMKWVAADLDLNFSTLHSAITYYTRVASKGGNRKAGK